MDVNQRKMPLTVMIIGRMQENNDRSGKAAKKIGRRVRLLPRGVTLEAREWNTNGHSKSSKAGDTFQKIALGSVYAACAQCLHKTV